jgi:mannose-1-phosphate guanylyltransferase
MRAARTAAAYIGTGNYRWNAGMSVAKATVLMDLLKDYKPDLHDGLQKIAAVWNDEALRLAAEPAAAQGKVAVVPATFGLFPLLIYEAR